MTVNLNGWRRIGVILVVIWISSITLSTISCYIHDGGNNFLHKVPPVGTEMTGNKIKFPDGKELTLDLPSNIEPWEVDWNSINSNQMKYKFNYQNIFIYFLVIPIFGWLFVELIVKSICWVVRGFNK